MLATERPRPSRTPAAPENREGGAYGQGGGDLRERPRQGYRIDREQIPDRKMQADPKHQQDDADLSELPGEIDIGDEARREGATAMPASK